MLLERIARAKKLAMSLVEFMLVTCLVVIDIKYNCIGFLVKNKS